MPFPIAMMYGALALSVFLSLLFSFLYDALNDSSGSLPLSDSHDYIAECRKTVRTGVYLNVKQDEQGLLAPIDHTVGEAEPRATKAGSSHEGGLSNVRSSQAMRAS